MRFWQFIVATFIVSGSIPARADKLAYFAPTPRYELEIRTGELILRTEGATRILKCNECNNAFIQDFINETRAAFERNPSARGTPKRAYAEWNGRRRLIISTVRATPFPLLPEHFLTLIARDRQQCR